MTTGNIIKDAQFSAAVLLNGNYQGQYTAGLYNQRIWSGGDSSTGASVRTRTKHYYYVPSHKSTAKRQKLIRRSYYTYSRAKFVREPHSYSMTYVGTDQPPGTYVHRSVDSGGGIVYNDVFSNCPLSLLIPGSSAISTASWTSSDQYRLIANLREKVVGTSFNAAVMLGESSKTLNMIGDTAIKLAKSLIRLRKGDFAGAIAATADPRSRRYSKKYSNRVGATGVGVSNKYLEVTYGWTPLLMDIKNGAESLSHKFNVPFKQRYRSRLFSSNSTRDGWNSFLSGGNLFKTPGHSTWSRQVIAEISDDPSFIGTVKLLDPLEFVWELIPLSFVADWILPVGSYLEARSASQLLTGKFVVTDRVSALACAPFNSTSTVGPYTITWTDSRQSIARLSRGAVYRTITSALDVPMPEVNPLSRAASFKHCMNGLALMTSIFGGSKLRG